MAGIGIARAIFGAALLGLAALPTQAQTVAAGEQIAHMWCANCHKVDGAPRRGSDAIPSFAAIANQKSTTAISLAAFLSTSHGSMPDYALSRNEIKNVSAYILSLRKPQ